MRGVHATCITPFGKVASLVSNIRVLTKLGLEFPDIVVRSVGGIVVAMPTLFGTAATAC